MPTMLHPGRMGFLLRIRDKAEVRLRKGTSTT
jgi:hypothetical protein